MWTPPTEYKKLGRSVAKASKGGWMVSSNMHQFSHKGCLDNRTVRSFTGTFQCELLLETPDKTIDLGI